MKHFAIHALCKCFGKYFGLIKLFYRILTGTLEVRSRLRVCVSTFRGTFKILRTGVLIRSIPF